MTSEPTARVIPTLGPVPALCLGTMMFGDQTDAGESVEIIARYAEAGGTFLDTADMYAGGESERIVGRAIAADRDRWRLATKVGNPVRGIPGSGGLSAAWVRTALARSLERLGTDRIDLYYLHRDDENTPLDDTLAALGEALEAGLIRAWGLSNYRGWKIAEIVRLADRMGIARPVAAQPYYHALFRLAEIDYIPACVHYGMAVVPYSPLARGVLTGKYAAGIPERSRAGRGDRRIAETEMRPALLDAARAFATHAEATGRRPQDLALRWVLENRAVTSVLIGPRTLEQLESYLAGPATLYTTADEAAIEAIAPTGSVIGTHADPQYPYRGRVIA